MLSCPINVPVVLIYHLHSMYIPLSSYDYSMHEQILHYSISIHVSKDYYYCHPINLPYTIILIYGSFPIYIYTTIHGNILLGYHACILTFGGSSPNHTGCPLKFNYFFLQIPYRIPLICTIMNIDCRHYL